MRACGATALLRSCLTRVLETVEVIAMPAPGAEAESSQYRDALLQLCLPSTVSHCKRRSALQLLLTGDIRDSRIRYHCPGVPPAKAVWAQSVAELLLPSRIEVFPRPVAWG